MADALIQVAPDSTGKMVDNTSLTVGANTVYRQRTNIAGAGATEIADVRAASPASADIGLVTRGVGSFLSTARGNDSQRVDAVLKSITLQGTVATDGTSTFLTISNFQRMDDGAATREAVGYKWGRLLLTYSGIGLPAFYQVSIRSFSFGGGAPYTVIQPQGNTNTRNASDFLGGNAALGFVFLLNRAIPSGNTGTFNVYLEMRTAPAVGTTITATLTLYPGEPPPGDVGAEYSIPWPASGNFCSTNTWGRPVGLECVATATGVYVAEVAMTDDPQSGAPEAWVPSYFRSPLGALVTSITNPQVAQQWEIVTWPGVVAARIRATSGALNGYFRWHLSTSHGTRPDMALAQQGIAHPEWGMVASGIDGGGLARRLLTDTTGAQVVNAAGDVARDVANTGNPLQGGGVSSLPWVLPTPVTADGRRVGKWLDRRGRTIVGPAKLPTYASAIRAVNATAGKRSLATGALTANTNKQIATIWHANTATKRARLLYVKVVILELATAAGYLEFEIVRITAAPVTGNPAITPLAFDSADAAAECTVLALPTTQGTVGAPNEAFGNTILNLGITSVTGPTTVPPTYPIPLVLFDSRSGMDENKDAILRAGIAEGFAINVRSTGVGSVLFQAEIQHTEEP